MSHNEGPSDKEIQVGELLTPFKNGTLLAQSCGNGHCDFKSFIIPSRGFLHRYISENPCDSYESF